MIYADETYCVVNDEGRAANLNACLARGLPRCERRDRHDGSLAIVGAGPSVRTRLDTLRSWPGEIWAINGAHDFLHSEGIACDFFGIDPLPGLAEYVEKWREGSRYYIAATCDPLVFDTLAGADVQVWFPEQEKQIYPDDAWTVQGGTSAITRAPYLGYLMGYRDITLFGADSSHQGLRYCYRDGSYREDSKAEVLAVMIGKTGPFYTEFQLMKQVSQLGVMNDQFNGKLKFDCDGLIQAYLNSPLHFMDKDGNLGPYADQA